MTGTCSHGTLQAGETFKDIGSVVVGSSVTTELLLINNNDCALDFELSVRQNIDSTNSNIQKNEPCVLEIEDPKGCLEARARKLIRLKIRPTRVITYQFAVEYRIIYPNEDLNKSQQNEILCNLTANGVYPKLAISDIKALGTSSNLSKDYLWKLFSLDTLNSSMNCEPNSDELMYSIATRQDAHRRIPNTPKVVVDFNFNAAPINSADTEIVLFVENTGVVPADWALLFPKDLQIELEYWSQTGNFTEEELLEVNSEFSYLIAFSTL